MKIAKEIEIVGKALWLKKQGILVISDLHTGFENALNKQGLLAPRMQFKEMIDDLKKIFDEIEKRGEKAREVVVLGDLKHEFGGISRQEWKDVSDILDFLKRHAKKIILIKGNHDTILEPIVKKSQGSSATILLKDFYIKENICFMHGHKMFEKCLSKNIKTIIIGHRHPAIVLRDKIKSESYKCFLVGRWKGKQVVIMPSFFPLVEGSDVIVEDTNLAMKLNLSNFDVYAVGDKVYGFGKLKSVKKLARVLQTD